MLMRHIKEDRHFRGKIVTRLKWYTYIYIYIDWVSEEGKHES